MNFLQMSAFGEFFGDVEAHHAYRGAFSGDDEFDRLAAINHVVAAIGGRDRGNPSLSGFKQLLQIDRALVEFAHIRLERADAFKSGIHFAFVAAA